VTYARVSSKEQEKEGFSIPAQLKLLKEYAAANGFAVAQEYIDVETAKQTGRAAFGEMVAYLKAHPSVRVMLVEKTDGLYRNLKDWVTVDELDVEMHFPKEGVVLSRESRSSEKFMHGIKVLMAKNYIDNLSEEARKGMQEKAEQGIWPTKTPLDGRFASKAKRGKHDFAFSGLIACHACGCAVVGEIKRNAMSITTAPATPISARATLLRAAASMCARKRSKGSSPNCSGG
jgi:DNA invertase Pin-like site-specific DNA recombinase